MKYRVLIGGAVAVPITIIDKMYFDSFVVTDFLNRYSIMDMCNTNEYVKQNHLHCCSIKDTIKYFRIIIRRKI